MHILFIGYGKTSRRIAKPLFQQGHQITTISRSAKQEDFGQHLQQDVNSLDLSKIDPVDAVYILLAPADSSVAGYRNVFLDAVPVMVQALQQHPVQRIIVVSSTRVYGQQQGEQIDDHTASEPADEKGKILLEMERAWQQAFPMHTIIVRPSGIYGISVNRMLHLAQCTISYPNIHWSNRIHIDDLAAFLVHLLHVEQPAPSYICSNNQPIELHEIIRWFQKQLNLPQLILESQVQTGKKIYARRMLESGFSLQHDQFFKDYLGMM